MVIKQRRQLTTTTMHLTQELLINVQCSGGFKKFYKGDKSLEDEEHSGQPLEVDNDQLRAIIEADPLLTTTTQEVAKEQCQLFYHRLTLEANWKGEKLDKCVPCKLTTNQKKWSF